MHRLRKKEIEDTLKIGKVLFDQGKGEKKVADLDGSICKIPSWHCVGLNPSAVEKLLEESSQNTEKATKSRGLSDTTIKRLAEKGVPKGFFIIRRGPKNSNEIYLASHGVYWLFVNCKRDNHRKIIRRIGIEDLALFLDFRELQDEDTFEGKRGIDSTDELKAMLGLDQSYTVGIPKEILKIDVWDAAKKANGIEMMERTDEIGHCFAIVRCLNAKDKSKFEKDLRRIIKVLLENFEHEILDFRYYWDPGKEEYYLRSLFYKLMEFKSIKVGEKALVEVSYRGLESL